MKKPRLPTGEEIRLWREVTRHDAKYRADEPLPEMEEVVALAPLECHPAPARGVVPMVRPTSAGPILEVLTGREATRLLKPYGPMEATLDLHGMNRVEAYGAVDGFLSRARAQGKRHVLIITGKGRLGEGVLRVQLPHWLNEPGLRRLVVGMAYAPANKGGSGVLHVIVKRF